MSQENVDVVRQMMERWNAGDVEGWLRCWHTNAEWISEPFKALEGNARTYRGHDELRRFLVEVLEGFADLGRIEHPRFRDVGDSVVVLAEYSAKAGASGPEVTTPWGWLFEVRDGKIVRGRDFLEQQEALKAVGLQEETMSPENVDVVREAIESNRSDYLEAHDFEARIEAVLALWDPSCEFTSVMAAVEPETYRGHDGLRRYINDLADSWEEWQNQVEEIFDMGSDTVFATIRSRVIGKGSGARAESRRAAVFELSKGKIVRGRTYPSREEALENVGLRE